jgi:hypothetical protein
MPTVATFDGIKIQFYWDEHPPPHFHAEVGEYRAMIDIETLEIIVGHIPRPQLRKVVTWGRTRSQELMEAWVRCRSDRNPGRIE